MKVVRLARIATEAEALRLRRITRRTAFRMGYAAVAFIFLFCALAMGHVAAWLALTRTVGPVGAAGIVAGADLVVMLILLLLASRGGQDKVEAEALQIRQTATRQIGQSLALLMLLRPVTSRMARKGLLGRVAATAIDGFLRR